MSSRLHNLSATLWVPALLVLGALVSLARELTIANTLGDSKAADVFRIAYTLPNYFSQTIGTIIVTTAVGLVVANDDIDKLRALFRWFSGVITLFFLICILTVGFQVDVFYPGYADDSAALLWPMRFGWLIFLICGVTLMPRAVLNIRRTRWPAASATLLRSGFFLILFFALKKFHVDILWAALLAAIFACLPLLASHGKAMIQLIGGAGKNVHVSLGSAGITLGAAVAFQLLASCPRFVDRYFASSFATGAISIVEYSYGLALVPVGIGLNAFIIVLLPRMLGFAKTDRGYSTLSRWSLAAFAMAFALSLALYLLPEWPRWIVDAALARPGAISGVNRDGLVELIGVQVAIAPLTLLGLYASHFLIAKGLAWRPIIAAGLKLLAKVTVFLLCGTLSYRVFAESYLLAELVFSIIVFSFYLLALKRIGES